MALVLTSGPAVEPVTLAEAKAHLRVDGSAEDTLIGSLIVTSRLHVEAALGLALITQSWSYFLDAWPPGRELALPLRPVQSIAAVQALRRRRVAADGRLPTPICSTAPAVRPRLVRQRNLTWPKPSRAANGIEIAFVAGYGDAAATCRPRSARPILLLIAHWYEHREPVEIGAASVPVPPMVSDLLQPYRPVRL